MEAFLLLIWPPVVIALGLWGAVTYLYFRARRGGARRLAAVASIILSLGGALGFVAAASIDDFNDYPGYTCAARDGYIPDGFPADRLPPSNPDIVSTFHPNIGWSHGYELFPAGVRCTYWTKDEPRFEMTTHSPWSYTLLVYGLSAISLFQVVRVARGLFRSTVDHHQICESQVRAERNNLSR